MKRTTFIAAATAASLLLCQRASAIGALLPTGYFHVSGNQIVSSAGDNVRLSCVGYDEPTGNYASDMSKIKSAGFNCVRQSWSDRGVCPKGVCNFAAQDALVNAASAYGIKVIWSHHSNEGVGACSWQQENGLWYDVNSGEVVGGVQWNALTANEDGCGNAGTVTYAQLKANSVAMAQHFGGNSTVIAFDLWNEPLVGNPVACGKGCQATKLNWGGNNGADLRLMCSDTGSAVHAANPGALIACEGAINFSGRFLNGTAFPSGTQGIGDLSAVAASPVNVGGPAVVYSVHEYPSWLSGQVPTAARAR